VSNSHNFLSNIFRWEDKIDAGDGHCSLGHAGLPSRSQLLRERVGGCQKEYDGIVSPAASPQ
jgi:hypothetical protein